MIIAFAVGIVASVSMIATLVWSILCPEKRIWPPVQPTLLLQIGVWALTVTIFGSAAVLGLYDWNGLGLPAVVRWGVGFPLVIVGNGVVWRGVHQLGMKATSGERDKLRTTGLYKYSRNPQYVADIAILVGWGVLCGSVWAAPIVVLGVMTLLIAPFAEEPWMEKMYGEPFRQYRQAVRRFI